MTQTESKRKAAHGPTVHAIKKAKYEAKQERRRQQQQENTNFPLTNDNWFVGREEYAILITVDDVRKIRQLRCKKTSTNADKQGNNSIETDNESARLIRIASWIEPFFDLKEAPTQLQKDSSGDDALSEQRLFIAEGTEPVRLMIQKCIKTNDETKSEITGEERKKSPPLQLVSILCKPATFFEQPTCLLDELEKLQCMSKDNSSPFKIIVGTEEALSEIVGFPVARGALACGVVPTFKRPFQWLKSLLKSGADDTTKPITSKQSTIRPRKILALDATSNTSNMGSILRTAAAFGIDAIILSDDSCDAWYRQAVRVSMGHVITVPTIRVSELREGLDINDKCGDGGLPTVMRWMRNEFKVQSFAAVVDDEHSAQNKSLPPLVSLEFVTMKNSEQSSSWACVLGNEGNGIRKEVVKETDYRIKISMPNDDVDSLSLPVAAGILIHGLASR